MIFALHFLLKLEDPFYLYVLDGITVALTIMVFISTGKRGTNRVLHPVLTLLTTVWGIFYFDKEYLKYKISLVLLFTIAFAYILFPFKDLNDFVTIQVSKLTNNQVFLQFDDMSINPLLLHLSLENVFVEASQLPTLKAEKITMTPGISALTKQEPNGSVSLQGFMGGELSLSISPDHSAPTKSEDGAKPAGTAISKFNISADAQNLNLKDIKEAAQLKLPIKGQLSMITEGLVDLSFREQPTADIQITINKFELPSTTINNDMMGTINLPELKLGQVELKGKMNAGKFVIESGKLGQAKDPINAEIKGDMMLSFTNMGGRIQPIIGAYNLTIDLKIARTHRNDLRFFLTLFEQYEKPTTDGSQFKFVAKSASMGLPPQFSPAP